MRIWLLKVSLIKTVKSILFDSFLTRLFKAVILEASRLFHGLQLSTISLLFLLL